MRRRHIKKIYDTFTSTAYLGNSKKRNKPKPKRSDDNIECVSRSIEENPITSRHRSAQLNIVYTTFCRIVHDVLSMCPYRVRSKQRYPAEGNLQIIHEESLHDQKVTIWRDVSAEKVIAP